MLGIERATVVGHSLGGGVAMQFAYQYPERCERLVLVCTGGVAREVNRFLRLASLPSADALLPLLRLRVVRLLGHAVIHAFRWAGTDLGRDAGDLLRMFDALPDATARRAFVRTLRAVVDWRGQVITMLDRCYLTRGMPTLLVWGAHDAIIPFTHARSRTRRCRAAGSRSSRAPGTSRTTTIPSASSRSCATSWPPPSRPSTTRRRGGSCCGPGEPVRPRRPNALRVLARWASSGS